MLIPLLLSERMAASRNLRNGAFFLLVNSCVFVYVFPELPHCISFQEYMLALRHSSYAQFFEN